MVRSLDSIICIFMFLYLTFLNWKQYLLVINMYEIGYTKIWIQLFQSGCVICIYFVYREHSFII